ncbi:universal stress protein [Paracnuella aquatica]|uniref:universal stress protein n=1 Tax=Paracnuella aquatica TaxID=2268757 RepID=UPI000DEF56AB|nr:universal stress protein [Paracnuella aquatica]RPD47285.1 universal stress protein [Paracnuella aquatica]
MKRILVPTDFSPCAGKALEYAACLAQKMGAEIILLHACDLLGEEHQSRKALIADYNKSIQSNASAQLKALKAQTTASTQVPVATRLYDGPVVASVLDATAQNKVDLIVMGTLGSSALHNKIFGSLTAELLSASPVPVIAVPHAYEWMEPKRVLLALNNPQEKTAVLQPAFDLATSFHSDVHAVVFSDFDEEGAAVLEKGRGMSRIVAQLQEAHPQTPVTTVHIGGNAFEDAIQEYINAHNINLLVMITHKRNKMQQLFRQSLTRKMSYHAAVPLMAIHASV